MDKTYIITYTDLYCNSISDFPNYSPENYRLELIVKTIYRFHSPSLICPRLKSLRKDEKQLAKSYFSTGIYMHVNGKVQKVKRDKV